MRTSLGPYTDTMILVLPCSKYADPSTWLNMPSLQSIFLISFAAGTQKDSEREVADEMQHQRMFHTTATVKAETFW